MNIQQLKYNIKIVVFMENEPHIVEEVVYFRAKMPYQIVQKYRWYFEFLTAAIKYYNPHRKVRIMIMKYTGEIKFGQDYIEEKTKNLLRRKKALVKRLGKSVIDDDLFGWKSQKNEENKVRLQSEIYALEHGEFNYWYPPEYINHVKKWMKKIIITPLN